MIHGRPWKLLTGDDPLYLPRNPRPHKAYGFGPVEQIVMTVNIALRRQVMQLQHFTEGNVPPRVLAAADRVHQAGEPRDRGTSQQAVLDEGLAPLMGRVKRLAGQVIFVKPVTTRW